MRPCYPSSFRNEKILKERRNAENENNYDEKPDCTHRPAHRRHVLHHVDLRLLQSCQRRSATMARKPGCGYQSPQHSIVRARSERGSMGICGARPATKRPRTDDSRIRLKTALAKGRMPHANRQEDFAPHLAYEVGAFNGCYRGAADTGICKSHRRKG